MKKVYIFLLPALLLCNNNFAQKNATGTIGTIQRDTPELNNLISADAEIELLAEGFEWSEGPAWIKEGGYLVFNDIPRNTTFKWSDEEGLSIFLRPAGFAIGGNPPGEELGSNGLFVHPVTGEIVYCDHGNRCVAVLDQENWTKTIIADRYNGKRLNSPNDVVISSKGHYYFTDPPYGLSWPDFPGMELDFCGVYHLTPDGVLSLVTKELNRPNGIGLSPDEKTLYVASSEDDNQVWLAVDVNDDGSTGGSRLFFDATGFDKYGEGGGNDGLAVDASGNIWATGPGGVMVFTPEGRHLGSIDTGTHLANCTFGGEEGNVLYITADMYLCRVKVNVKGIGFD